MEKPKLVSKRGVSARQRLLKTFTIDYTSEVDDRRYFGKFTTKKLSLADLASLGVRKAQLNGGMHHDMSMPGHGVDASTDDLNAMIAHLEVALQDWPEWWDLDVITDGDLLAKVFEEVVSHEDSFRRSGWERTSGDSGHGSDGSGDESGERDLQKTDSRRVAGEMVDEEVQSALEP